MNHENENKGLGSSKNGYTQDPKVLFGVGKDLQLLIEGPKKNIYTMISMIVFLVLLSINLLFFKDVPIFYEINIKG